MSKNKYSLFNDTQIIFETPDDGYSYFFGYYDKPSLNKDNTKLLTHRVSFDGRDVQDGDVAEIGYFDLNSKEFIKIDETLAWNWQQGSQLQWLPPSFNEKIIYNSIKDNRFVSIIYDLNTKEKKIIPFPIYVIHPNGKEALGVNYERLYWCRAGYNYQNIKNEKWNCPYHKDDGIFRIDLENGEVELIISTKDIISVNKLEEFEYCNNWLEHMMYNPNGDRFMFMHRWEKNGVDYTRNYVADSVTGKILREFPDVGFYSHSFWKSDNILTIWTRDFDVNQEERKKVENIKKNIGVLKLFLKPIYRALKPILPKKISNIVTPSGQLYDIDITNGKYEKIGDGILNKYATFGHIVWYKDKINLLTDTYQDKDKFRWLYIFNTQTNELEKLAKFYSFYNDSVYRCDLHPRLSLDENLISIDVAMNEKRKQIILKVKK